MPCTVHVDSRGCGLRLCCRGVVKELMHGAPPTALPPETEDAGLEGMLSWHARSRWFEVNGQFSEAYVARMKSIDVLLPASSQGVLGQVRASSARPRCPSALPVRAARRADALG